MYTAAFYKNTPYVRYVMGVPYLFSPITFPILIQIYGKLYDWITDGHQTCSEIYKAYKSGDIYQAYFFL